MREHCEGKARRQFVERQIFGCVGHGWGIAERCRAGNGSALPQRAGVDMAHLSRCRALPDGALVSGIIVQPPEGCIAERTDWRFMQIIVRDNNVDQALRALKKKLQREGVYREMKLRRHYEKPSEKRARERAAAVRRARKLDRKRAERDGVR
jgi:small subunit ribosomal protein S21